MANSTSFKKGYRTEKGKANIERAVEIACKRLSGRALAVLERAVDEESTPGLEMRWRLAAAKEILDRGYGRPKQTIDANIEMKSSDFLIEAIKASRAANKE